MQESSTRPLPRRLTQHRQEVLDAVAARPAHLSAAQVYDLVHQAQPRIAFATVYNALHYLVKVGLIAEVRQPDGVVAYDRNTAPHDHIVCRLCGRLDDVPAEPGRAVDAHVHAAVADSTGYTVEGHRVEYTGICPTCRGAGR